MNSQRHKQSRVQGGWACHQQSACTKKKSPQNQSPFSITEPAPHTKMLPALRPPNFSWVVEGLLAGSAFPSKPSHFQYLKDNNIHHVVTLSEWKPPMHLAPPSLEHHHIPIEEFSAPNLQQIIHFTDLVDKAKENNEGVMVHCYWGRGRTGTMLAAYLVSSQGMPPMQAVNHIRRMRPYSVETYAQEDAVIAYAEHLVKKGGQGGVDSDDL